MTLSQFSRGREHAYVLGKQRTCLRVRETHLGAAEEYTLDASEDRR